MDEGSFKKVCIIGVGLIGGSLALALKKAGLCEHVIGLGRRLESLRKALELAVVDEIALLNPEGERETLSPREAISQADLIVLATPPSTIPAFFPLIAENAKDDCLVTDVGSVKRRIIQEAERVLPQRLCFIGGHPLAGMEKRGVDWSNADLFERTVYVLTPCLLSNPEGMKKMRALVVSIGAVPLILDAETHDYLLAYTSHFPHIVAFALSLLLQKAGEKNDRAYCLAASGFRSVTRIAKSPPDIWEEIFLENRENLLKIWEEWEEIMDDMKKRLIEGNMKEELEKAKRGREFLDEITLQEGKGI
ncbi:prephenate dehydrogenase/arogenate dehydrogenase family protein [bacterium]|nr:prephenate dehydrogenase/arogenate dehydrogenase family protein [bacterium]